MRTAAPKGGGGVDGNRSLTGNRLLTPPPPPGNHFVVGLPALRTRLGAARRRLVERIAEDWADDQRFPASGWTRMLADIQAAIQAVDAVIAEGEP